MQQLAIEIRISGGHVISAEALLLSALIQDFRNFARAEIHAITTNNMVHLKRCKAEPLLRKELLRARKLL
jgi:hypothetical protein